MYVWWEVKVLLWLLHFVWIFWGSLMLWTLSFWDLVCRNFTWHLETPSTENNNNFKGVDQFYSEFSVNSLLPFLVVEAGDVSKVTCNVKAQEFCTKCVLSVTFVCKTKYFKNLKTLHMLSKCRTHPYPVKMCDMFVCTQNFQSSSQQFLVPNASVRMYRIPTADLFPSGMFSHSSGEVSYMYRCILFVRWLYEPIHIPNSSVSAVWFKIFLQ